MPSFQELWQGLEVDSVSSVAQKRLDDVERTVRDLTATLRQIQSKRDKPREQIFPSRGRSTNVTQFTLEACALECEDQTKWASEDVPEAVDWNTTAVFNSGSFTPASGGITVAADGAYEVKTSLYGVSAAVPWNLGWVTVNGAQQSVKQKMDVTDLLSLSGDSFGGLTIVCVLNLSAGDVVGASMARQSAASGSTSLEAGCSQIIVTKLEA